MATKKAVKKKATKKAPATKQTAPALAKDNIDALDAVQLTASVELGRTRITLRPSAQYRRAVAYRAK